MIDNQVGDLREVHRAALAYLNMVTRKLEAMGLRKLPTVKQQAMWMVPTGPGSWTSEPFEREIPSVAPVNMRFQMELLREKSSELDALTEQLALFGIPQQQVHYGWVLPLFYSGDGFAGL